MRSLEESLPPGYGEVLAELHGKSAAKVGLVMPIYGRSVYLKRALKSLAASELHNTVVCLVDETNSLVRKVPVEGYTGFEDLDSPGHSYKTIHGSREEVVSKARSEEACLAFTSSGQLKNRLAILLRKAPGITLYVRNDQLKLRPLLKARLKYLSRQTPDAKAEELVRHWHPANVPVVKIFKKRHANMFDSYRHGFRMLAECFACEYFVCLDSDTLVKANWLQELLRLHETFQNPERPLLVSGFHTKAHKTIIEGQDHHQKRSVGGANLLFNKSVWQNWVEPSLTSLYWDVELGKKILKSKGRLIVSKPSVVAHIGKRGVWSSWLNVDRAADF